MCAAAGLRAAPQSHLLHRPHATAASVQEFVAYDEAEFVGALSHRLPALGHRMSAWSSTGRCGVRIDAAGTVLPVY